MSYKYDTVLFDLDGTLTDSAEGIINCAIYSFEKMGLPLYERDWYRVFIGPPLKVTYAEDCGLNEEDTVKAIAYFRERYFTVGKYENCVYGGIEDMLKELKSAGLRLAVATSKLENTAKEILVHFGLDRYFDYIGGGLPDGSRDYKDQVIEYVMDILKADKHKTVMIGDRIHDIEGAKKVGIDSIGALYGYGSREELENAGALFIADTPQDITRLLLNLN